MYSTKWEINTIISAPFLRLQAGFKDISQSLYFTPALIRSKAAAHIIRLSMHYMEAKRSMGNGNGLFSPVM